MSTNGDYIRPLFPDLTLPDDAKVGLQRAIPVGPVGGMTRDALSHVFPGIALADDDWVTVTWNDDQALGDAVATPGLLDDDFAGTALNANWAVILGQPVVSGGKLRFSNDYPQKQIRSNVAGVVAGRTITMLGCSLVSGSVGGAHKNCGLLIQDVTNPNQNFIQLIRAGASLLLRTNPGVIATVSWSATAHANLRVRCTATTVFFEASANGTTWSVLAQQPLPQWTETAEAFVKLYGGCDVDPSAGYADPSTEVTFDRVIWS